MCSQGPGGPSQGLALGSLTSLRLQAALRTAPKQGGKQRGFIPPMSPSLCVVGLNPHAQGLLIRSGEMGESAAERDNPYCKGVWFCWDHGEVGLQIQELAALCHIARRVMKNSAANPVCPTKEFSSACFLGELCVAAFLYALDPVFAGFLEVGAVSWLYWLLLLLQRCACCCSTVSSKQELAALPCRVPPAPSPGLLCDLSDLQSANQDGPFQGSSCPPGTRGCRTKHAVMQ